MAGEPYRSSAGPPDDEATEAVVDQATRLGLLRSVHAAPPLWRELMPAIALPVLICGAAVAGGGLAALPFAAGFGALGVGLVAYGPLRRRGRRVEVHAHGIVVVTPSSRDVVVFEDVDALWYEMDFSSFGTRSRPRVLALRLVDHGGGEHRVPLSVQEGLTAYQWIVRHCSEPLLADAQAALRRGETLTFGDVRLDREGIAFAKGARVPWAKIRIARLEPGSIALYRRMPIVPWRTIRLDRVPHPSLFVKLFREVAPAVEVDDTQPSSWAP